MTRGGGGFQTPPRKDYIICEQPSFTLATFDCCLFYRRGGAKAESDFSCEGCMGKVKSDFA